MANGFGTGGQVASYPSNGFPGINFYGAGVPGRAGVTNQASSARSAGVPAVARNHQIIALIVVVAVGYFIWHYTATLK